MSTSQGQQPVPSQTKMDNNDNQVQGRRCLVVAYHAPGASRPASIRIRRLISGLRDLGWHVGVLSTTDDPTGVDMPDGVEYTLIKKPGRPSRASPSSTKSASDSGNPLVRLAAAVSHKLPIPLRAWWLLWTGQALRWARRFDPEIIFSKSNPPESHMMAAILARKLDVPWVAELWRLCGLIIIFPAKNGLLCIN